VITTRPRSKTGRFESEWAPGSEDLVLELFRAGAPDLVIAARTGRLVGTIRSLRRRRGWNRRLHRIVAAEPIAFSGAAGWRVYWTDERVANALRDYARKHPGPLPSGTKQWDAITRGNPQLPVSARVLEQYDGLGNAWRALLPAAAFRERVRLTWVPWTEAEDAYVEEHIERLTVREIAQHLGRSSGAVRQHMKRALDLASPSEAREWWSVHEVAEHYGCPVPRVRQLVDEGLLPARRGGSRVRIDPSHLPGVNDGADHWPTAEERARTAELERRLRAQSGRHPDRAPQVITRYRRAS